MKKYRGFISYSRQDTSNAIWFHAKLEKYVVPKQLREQYSHLPEKLGKFFKDTEDLSVHSNLDDALKTKLQESEYLIVICSPAAAQSHWVNEEIKYFKSLGKVDNIIPVLVDGEPNATTNPKFSPSFEAFPEALRINKNEEGEIVSIENPIGADIRKGKDPKAKALIRIISYMLEMDFDDIWQREKKRNLLKMVSLSILGLIITVIIVFGVLKWMNELQLRAVNSELSKIVKDKNFTKVNVKAIETKISEHLQTELELHKLEDRVINTRLAVKHDIKSNINRVKMYQNVSGVNLPKGTASSKLKTCRTITRLNLPTVSVALQESYCKCLYKETVSELAGNTTKLQCEDPIQNSLGLPKTSNYRIKKQKESQQHWAGINQIMKETDQETKKIVTNAIVNSNNTLNNVMKNLPGWDEKSQTVTPKNTFVYYCTSMNHEQLPNIDEILIKNYCKCMYTETKKVVGDLNVSQKIPTIADLQERMKDPYKFMKEEEEKMKKEEDYRRRFQLESEKHKEKCMEPMKDFISK